MRLRFAHHRPVARHRLTHGDSHRLRLGVFQHDFIGRLEYIVEAAATRQFLEGGLFPVRGNVKRLAQLQAHDLVLRRMVDAILADELRVALPVPLVDADHALGQGHAEAFALVVEFDEHADLDLLADFADLPRVVVIRTLEQEFLSHRHPARRHQRNLLGLVLRQRGGTLQRVEMVFKQRFLLHVGSVGHFCRHGPRRTRHRLRLAYPVEVARHQLQLGVRIGRPALIGQRHPAVQVEPVVIGIQFGHIIRTPCQTGGQIGQLQVLQARRRVEQRDDQGRRIAQRVGYAGKRQSSRHAGFDAAVGKLEYHAVVGRKHGSGFAGFHVGARMHAYDADLASDIFFEQLLRGQQIEIEILFLQPESGRIRQIAQLRGFRTHLRRHFAPRQLIEIASQPDPPRILHQRQIVVVDRDRHA